MVGSRPRPIFGKGASGTLLVDCRNSVIEISRAETGTIARGVGQNLITVAREALCQIRSKPRCQLLPPIEKDPQTTRERPDVVRVGLKIDIDDTVLDARPESLGSSDFQCAAVEQHRIAIEERGLDEIRQRVDFDVARAGRPSRLQSPHVEVEATVLQAVSAKPVALATNLSKKRVQFAWGRIDHDIDIRLEGIAAFAGEVAGQAAEDRTIPHRAQTVDKIADVVPLRSSDEVGDIRAETAVQLML